jgi:two-component system CheB/CheR fusion protein
MSTKELARFRALADAAPVMIWVAGPDDFGAWFNRPWLEFTGQTMEEAVREGWACAVHPDDRARALATSADAFAHREPFRMEFRLRRHDGTYRWVLDHGVPQVSEGEFEGYVGTCIDITERKEAERALRESESYYRHLFEGLPAAVCTCEPGGAVTFFNEAAVELWGRRPKLNEDRWCGSWRMHHPDGRPMPLDTCPMADAIKRGVSLNGVEAVVERPDGSRRNVLAHPRPLRDATGRMTGAVNILVDVTDREQFNLARATLAAIVESSLDAIIGKDLSGKILSWNRAAERLFGYTADEAIGRKITFIIPKERRGEETDILERIHRGEIVQPFETIRVARDGREIAVSVSVSPLRDAFGHLIGASNITRDITAQREAEASRREGEERFRYLADHAPVLIWLNGLDGCEFVNSEYLRFLGCSFDDVRGMGWVRFVHPEDRDCYLASYETAMRQRGEFDAQFRFLHTDGQYRWLRSVAVPRRGLDGAFLGYVGCSTDVTAVKELEASLLEADRRKDEFLAMLGHELRNPLAALTTCVALLTQNPDDERRAWGEDLIARQVEQLRRLVDDLVDVARIRRGKIELHREIVDLRERLDAAVGAASDLMVQHSHRLAVSFPSQPVLIDADPARLEQIVTNLLTNAAKYTPEGGDIRLAVELAPNRAGPAGSATEVIIRCLDNGAGIPPGALESIFEPFVQFNAALDRSHSGLGIGLTLVKRLAELHGGSIRASSEGLGRGSEFTLRLPVVNEPTPLLALDGNESGLESEAVHGWKALVIDDNQDYAEGLAILLEQAGYRVSLAPDGHAGITAASSQPPDLVLLDLGLPGLDGYAVAEKLRSMRQLDRTTIVAVSGYAPGNGDDAVDLFDARLVKPVNYSDLLELVHRKVRERSSKHRKALA